MRRRKSACTWATAASSIALAGWKSDHSYVGVSSTDSHLYFMGNCSNNQMLDLGAIATWKQTTKCQ